MVRKILFLVLILMGILSIAYGGLVASLHAGSNFYFIWFIIGLLCFGVAVICLLRLWARFPKWLTATLSVSVLLAACLFIVVEILIINRFNGFRTDSVPDTVIVLGAQVHTDGPSPVLRFRLDTAATFLQENPDSVCIVSGGQGYNEPFSEAEGMKSYLVGQGISSDRIICEDRSTNTLENIIFSSKLIPDESRSVGIITNNFHLYRATKIAEKQRLEDCTGISAGSTRLFLPNNMLREFFGVLKDFLVGNM